MNDVPTKNPARRSFTDEFKADAVQLVVQGNRPIAQVARELEINESSMGSAEALVESGVYAARLTASIIMASNSIGVSFPSPRCLRLR